MVIMPTISRLRHHVSFAQVIEGETESPQRRRCECSVIEHLTASHITLEAVAINADGCSFIIDSRDSTRFATAIRELNVAVKLRDHCARIALTRNATDWPLPSLGRLMHSLEAESIDVVHLVADANALTVVVDDQDADRVAGVFSRFYQPAA
jgi:aspartokinase